MPHITINMYPGHTKEEKEKLAMRFKEVLMEELNAREAGISVGIQEVSNDSWKTEVYDKVIMSSSTELIIKPGYEL